ncbi:MAG TPA: geranylgeranylglyceryl/heptaprenylglyceryl phosphate synthase [Cytophagaceae bacterium]|jgi:putative glycerol-1-phosphate prenyltransferase
MNLIYKGLLSTYKTGQKAFAVLLDPDKLYQKNAEEIIKAAESCNIDYFFVGGSILTQDFLEEVILEIKRKTNIPVIIFPGSNQHISKKADGILLLSLISGRNPEFLIGQHVISAPILKESGLEILPTGYMLVDCGSQTTVSYISNTTPIPYDKNDIAACTAMAGEMLGLKLIFLDGGSGAAKPVHKKMIASVRKAVDVPIIVGGGINSSSKALDALSAGADLIVIGNGIEERTELMYEVSEAVSEINNAMKQRI